MQIYRPKRTKVNGRDREGLVWTSLRSRYIHHLEADTPDDQKAEFWCYIIREYSGRLFSMDVDCLPAISGLAQHFGTVGTGEYRLGIQQLLRFWGLNARLL
jgi:hypothetical protein